VGTLVEDRGVGGHGFAGAGFLEVANPEHVVRLGDRVDALELRAVGIRVDGQGSELREGVGEVVAVRVDDRRADAPTRFLDEEQVGEGGVSAARPNVPVRVTPALLIEDVTIVMRASGNACSRRRPRRRYSLSSMVTMRTESSGLSSSLASKRRRSMKASHLLWRSRSSPPT